MFNFFRKDKILKTSSLEVDFHSHLLPNLDDGVESVEESLEIINELQQLGYKKVITTPHVMQDFYFNSAENIIASVKIIQQEITKRDINIHFEAAAEYFLDDHLMKLVANESEDLLTFGDNYVLFETSFMNQPLYLNDFIFRAKSRGLNPILAHPERYAFIQSNPELLDDLIQRGVYLQLNINSISGYYSKQVKKLAEKMIDQGQVHFLGSDCHNLNHLNVLKHTRKEKYYRKALALPLLNNTI